MAVNWDDFKPVEEDADASADIDIDAGPEEFDWADFKPVDDYAGFEDRREKDSFGEAITKEVVNTPARWKKIAGGNLMMAGDHEEQLQSTLKPLIDKYEKGEEPGLVDQIKAAADLYTTLPSIIANSKVKKGSIYDRFQSYLSNAGRDLAETAAADLKANQTNPDSPVTQFAADVARGAIDMGPALAAGFITRDPKAASAFNPAFMGVFGTQIAGQTYADRIEQGLSESGARDAVRHQLAAEVIPEAIPVAALLKRGSPFMKRWFDATVGEGFQEGFTAIMEQVYDKTELENMSLKDALLDLDWKDVGYNAMVGAGVGTTLAVPAQAADSLSSKPKFDQHNRPSDIPFEPTHNINIDGQAMQVQQATKRGKVVPDYFVDRDGNVYRDTTAVPVRDPSDTPMDANATAEAVKEEVMGEEKPISPGIINSATGRFEPVQYDTKIAQANQEADRLGITDPAQRTRFMADFLRGQVTDIPLYGQNEPRLDTSTEGRPAPVPFDFQVQNAALEAEKQGIDDPKEKAQFIIDSLSRAGEPSSYGEPYERPAIDTMEPVRDELSDPDMIDDAAPTLEEMGIDERTGTVLPVADPADYDPAELEQRIKNLEREAKRLDKPTGTSILWYLANNGGLDTEMWKSEFGLDPADIRQISRKGMPFGKPLFRKGTGHGPDWAREQLQEINAAGLTSSGTDTTYEQDHRNATDAAEMIVELVEGKRDMEYLPGDETAEMERQRSLEGVEQAWESAETRLDEAREYERILENRGQEAADEYFYQRRALEHYYQNGIDWKGEPVAENTEFDGVAKDLDELYAEALAVDESRAEQTLERLSIRGARDAEIALALNSIIRGAKNGTATTETEKGAQQDRAGDTAEAQKKKTREEFKANIERLRAEKAKRREKLIAGNDGNIVGIEAVSKDGQRYAAVLEDMGDGEKPEVRLQFYDKDGFSGHMVFPDTEKALDELLAMGYRKPAQGAMDRLQGTDEWNAGMDRADVIRGIKKPAESASQEVRANTVDVMRQAVDKVGEKEFDRLVNLHMEQFADEEMEEAEAAAEIEGVARRIVDGAYDSRDEPLPESTSARQERRAEGQDRKERRQSGKARALYEEMTRDELMDQLLKHELTGIKGLRSFVVDVQDAPVVASIDADSLKWINDNLSPEHGNALLQAVADALEAETDSAYHVSGDEFYVLAETREEAQRVIDAAEKALAAAEITATQPDGSAITMNGLNITAGIGATKNEADIKLKSEKRRKEAAGERAARGEQPPGAVVAAAEGQQSEGETAEVAEARQAWPLLDPPKFIEGKGKVYQDLFSWEDAQEYASKPDRTNFIIGGETRLEQALYQLWNWKEHAENSDRELRYAPRGGGKTGKGLIKSWRLYNSGVRSLYEWVENNPEAWKEYQDRQKALHELKARDRVLTPYADSDNVLSGATIIRKNKKNWSIKWELNNDRLLLPPSVLTPESAVEQQGEGEATAEEVDAAANQAATSTENDKPEPTDAEKEAGNYEKGHVTIQGFDITIENPAGSKRNPEWPTLKHHYGYFKRSVGADSEANPEPHEVEHVDAIIKQGVDISNDAPIWVIDQYIDGKFDEHKVVLGAASEQDARDAYLSMYEKGWDGLHAITQTNVDELAAWIDRVRENTAQRKTEFAKAEKQADEAGEDTEFEKRRQAIRDFFVSRVQPKLEEFYSVVRQITPERLERNNIKPEGINATEWLLQIKSKKPTWSHGRKSGSTGIQMLSTKDLWPTDDGIGERLRKSMLSAIRALNSAPGLNDAWLRNIENRLPPFDEVPRETAQDEVSNESNDADLTGDAGKKLTSMWTKAQDWKDGMVIAAATKGPAKGKYTALEQKEVRGTKTWKMLGGYEDTIEKAISRAQGELDSQQAVQQEVSRIDAAQASLAEKLNAGESPTKQEFMAAFPQIEEWHTWVRQPEISPFLRKYFGFSRGRIRAPLGRAAGTRRTDFSEYPIVYLDRLADVLKGQSDQFDLTPQTEASAEAEEQEQQSRAEKAEIDKTVEGFDLEGEITPIEQSADQQGLLAGGEEESRPAATAAEDRMVASGEQLYSKSGRKMSPAPKIDTTTDRKAQNSIKRLNAWLLHEAQQEAADEPYLTTLLSAIDINNISQSDQDTLNDVVFGNIDGPSAENRRPPEETEAPVEQAEAEQGDAAADAVDSRIRESQVIDHVKWRDMGTTDKVKTIMLEFTDPATDAEMNYGELTKESDFNWKFDGKSYESLTAAKKAAYQSAIERLKADGYVSRIDEAQESFDEVMAVMTGQQQIALKNALSLWLEGKNLPAEAEARGKASFARGWANTLIPGTWERTDEGDMNGYDLGQQTAETWLRDNLTPAERRAEAERIHKAMTARTGELEDFGEKLGGARKDMEAMIRKEFSDDEIASLPLSKIWPKSQLDTIEDPRLAAFATAARAYIPNKPRRAYKVKRWVEDVKTMRNLMRDSIDSTIGIDRVMELLRNQKGLQNFALKVDLMASVNRELWPLIGRVEFHPDAYTYDAATGKKTPTPSGYATIDGRRERFHVDTREKLIEEARKILDEKSPTDAAPAKGARLKFEVRGRPGNYAINKTGDRDYTPLISFKTSQEAFKYRDNQYDELVKLWEQHKERFNVTKADMRRKENRPRSGKDYRSGKDVTPQMFMETFGFRGVEFGNWVKQGKGGKDRQGMLNQAFDALMDLAGITGLPPRAISLDGTLGLGFGSRGHGWASAHYEPDKLVINLTKTRGAGALAHEWFHAMDNYFQRQYRGAGNTRETSYITYSPENYYVHKKGTRLSETRFKQLQEQNGIRNSGDWTLVEGIRPEISAAFTDLVKALNESPMNKRAAAIDKGKQDGYWSRVIERAARSFENYIVAKMMQGGYHNDYLANIEQIDSFSRDPSRFPYLLEEELPPVENAFDTLFSSIETVETERGLSLREGETRYAINSESGPGQLDMFMLPEADQSEASKKMRVKTLRKFSEVKTGVFYSGVEKVETVEDAAHVMSALRKYNQEQMMVLVLDKENRPISVLRMSIGTGDAASVFPRDVIGAVNATPGAASYFLAHNHPSGISEPSRADETVTERITSATAGTGVEYRGHIISGLGGEITVFMSPEIEGRQKRVTPTLRARTKATIPLTEGRVTMDRVKGAATSLGSPADTRDFVKSYLRDDAGKIIDGVLWLDNRNNVIGFTPVSTKEMQNLRTNDTATGASRLAREARRHNAMAMIVTMGERDTKAEQNIQNFATATELRLLDSFNSTEEEGVMESAAEFGRIGGSNPDFRSSDSRAQQKPVKHITEKRLQELVDRIQSEHPGLQRVIFHVRGTQDGAFGAGSTAEMGRVKGGYYENTNEIVLIAENIENEADALRVMRHELVGHYGLRKLLNAEGEFDALLERVYAGRGDELADLYGWVASAYPDLIQQGDARKIADEMLARAAEVKQEAGLMGRIMDELIRLLRKFGLIGDKADRREVDALIRLSAKNLRQQEAKRARWEYLDNKASYMAMAGLPAEDAPPFYSQMKNVLRNNLPGKGTGRSYRQMVEAWARKGEFKRDELEWSGLLNWLQSNDMQKLTVGDVIDFMDANQLQIRELIKGTQNTDDRLQRIEDIKTKLRHVGEFQNDMLVQDEVAPGVYTQFVFDELEPGMSSSVAWMGPEEASEGDNFTDMKESIEFLYGNDVYALLEEANNIMMELSKEQFYGDTGMTEYHTYTLPGGKNYRELLLSLPNEKRDSLQVRAREIAEKYGLDLMDTSQIRLEGLGATEQEVDDFRKYLFQSDGNWTEYRSPHWNEPNILAHIRFDERTDAQGRRVLHVAEIQSDWHQAGRKEGYDSERAKIDSALKEYEGLMQQMSNVGLNRMAAEDRSRIDELRPIVRGQGRAGKGVPDAPFKTTWPLLAMKRMIRYASENGFDAITWDTGEVQADRYDLSKQVDYIDYVKSAPDRYNVAVVGKNGDEVFSENAITISRVTDVLGKDIADKMEKGEGQPGGGRMTLRGLDLKVGGEGMRSFYDEMLPKMVNKYVKKWGGKTKLAALITGQADKEESYIDVHSLDITDEMRESVMRGQPMFSRLFHGSPHKFSKFELDKIGTGEGAQAYGHGLYFAESPGVANTYVNAGITNTPAGTAGISIDGVGVPRDWQELLKFEPNPIRRDAIHRLQKNNGDINAALQFEVMDKTRDAAVRAEVKKLIGRVNVEKPAGQLYEVDIPDSAIDNMLDWDKPLSEQPESVQKALMKDPILSKDVGLRKGGKKGMGQWSGSFYYGELSRRLGGQKMASAYLADKYGIPGIKYLDQGSRAAGEGTRNFVVFDDSILTILNRNGEPVSERKQQEVIDEMEDAQLSRKPQTETPEFRAWFGDSKVVDENGEPMVVYHGTGNDFDTFNPNARRRGFHTVGYFFTGDPEMAEGYAYPLGYDTSGQASGEVNMPVYLSIKKPLVFDGFDTVTGTPNKLWSIVTDQTIINAKKDGYDGIIAKGVIDAPQTSLMRPHDVYIAFSNNQIKAAYGNRGTFDPNNPDIRYRRVEDEPAGGNFGMPDERLVERFIRWFQDAFNRVKKLQSTIEAQGGTVTNESDVYQAEELSSGKIASRLDRLDKQHMRPLLDEMDRENISLEALDEYLMMRHARERNYYIAEINDAMPDGGSGITNDEATDYLLSLDSETARKLESLADKVYRVNDKMLDDLVAAGMLNQETVDEWRERYSFYVPMKGKEGAEDHPVTGSGYSVRGAGIRAAMGRGAGNVAESPTAHTFAQAESTIVRTEKAQIGKALIKLVRDNPDPNLWTINQRTFKRFIDMYGEPFEGYEEPPEGMIEGLDYHRIRVVTKSERKQAKAENRPPVSKVVYRLDPAYQQRPDVITVMEEGQQLTVHIKDKLVAEQLRRANMAQMSAIVASFAQVNRYLAMINTALNPEFVITNFERDLQTAMVNLSGEHSAGLAAEVAKNTPAAIRGIWQSTFETRGKSPWRAEYEEMRAAGGTVGFFGLDDIESRVTRIQSQLDIKHGVLGSTKRGVRRTRDLVLDANLSVENAVRLSAYKVAKERWIANGMAPKEARDKAASLAKNLTVNFNRKGEFAPVMNSAYLFYNASIQGSFRILSALKHPRVRKIVTGVAATAFTLAMFNRNMGGDDDDGIPHWDKISDYTKQTHLIIMNPDGSGNYFKIRLPYGYNVFFYTGTEMHDLAFGTNKTAGGSAMNMLTAFLNAYNPIQGADFIDTIMPTVAKPFVQHSRNKNFMDTPIMPEDPFARYDVPDSQKAWKSTNEELKETMEFLNELTGGNETHSGWFDVSPETIKHYVGWVTGGAGMFAARTLGTATNFATGEPIEQKNVPFLRTLGGKPGSHYDTERFYDAVKKTEAVKAQVKLYRGTDQYGDYKEENAQVYRLGFHLNRYRNNIRRLREKRDKAYMEDNTDLAREFSEKMRQEMMEFSMRYDEAIKQQQEGAETVQ